MSKIKNEILSSSSPLGPDTVRSTLLASTIHVPLCIRLIFTHLQKKRQKLFSLNNDPSGRVVEDVGLRPLSCRDCGFDSRRGRGNLSVVSVVYFQVEVSATARSLVQKSLNPYPANVENMVSS